MNEKGYTLIEAMFQLVVLCLFLIFVLIMLWFAEMRFTMLTDEQTKWELFVSDLNLSKDISTFSVRDDQKE